MKKLTFILLGCISALFVSSQSFAETTMSQEGQYISNSLGFYLGGVLVAFMAAGFCMLESGLVTTKSVSTIAAKNIGKFAICSLIFFFCGYNLAYGIPEGGFIVGLDLETGAEQWRFHTVARPGSPGGETWNNLPLQARSGGSVWNSGSYDAELGLVYFGAAPTYDTGPLLENLGVDGVTNDALYTNSTMALRPRTGELAWHFQHMPNDQLDLDWVYERQLDELEVNGQSRKVVFTAGKMALYDVVDAETGEYLESIDLGLQKIVSAVNPQTGAKSINPDSVPNREANHLLCPYFLGGRNWQAGAYNPDTKMLYLPALEMCMMAGLMVDGNLLSTGIEATPAPRADSDGKFGRLQAINMETMEMAWRHRELTPPSTPLLSTAGGLVFGGNLDNSFKAFDAQTGVVLWETTLDHLPSSFPITYAVDGKQYVAIVKGQPSRWTGSLYGIIQGMLGPEAQSIPTPSGQPGLVVFAVE